MTSALTKRPARLRPIREGAVAGAGPMKFIEGQDGENTEQSSVNQKIKIFFKKAQKNSNSRIYVAIYQFIEG